MNWLHRHTCMLKDENGLCLIVGDESSGIPYLIQALDSTKRPLIWVALESSDEDDDTRVGNKLSDAFQAALGARIFGHGMPFQYGLGIFTNYLCDLGPFQLAITGASYHVQFSKDMVELAETHGVGIVVAADDADSLVPWMPTSSIFLSEADLALAKRDVEELLLGGGTSEDIDWILRQSHGRYEAVLAIVAAMQRRPPPVRPAPGGWAGPPTHGGENAEYVLKALLAKRDWQGAFKLAVVVDPWRATEMLPEAADEFLGKGAVGELAQGLSRLIDQGIKTPKLMYWYLQANAAIGRASEVSREVRKYLSHNRAPELKATYASITRHAGALEAAEEALSEHRTQETLAAAGFLRTFNGQVEEGRELLREAFQAYVADARFHRAIQIANSIGATYVRQGDFEKGVYWGTWSLNEIARHGLSEELLRLSSTNLVAYSKLLVGQRESGWTLLQGLSLKGQNSGLPTLEGLVSTLGDYELVEGNVESAIQYYEKLSSNLSSNLIGFAALHLVRGYLRAGWVDRALVIAGQAKEVASGSEPSNEGMARIAWCLAGTRAGVATDADWQELERFPAIRSNAPCLAEVVIQRAALALDEGRSGLAVRTLNTYKQLLGGLGRDGWILLAGSDAMVNRLRNVGSQATISPVDLEFCGARSVRTDGASLEASPRHSDFLAVLAANPTGLSGEALLLEIYGDGGNISTLKAVLSRLRRLVPIESQPYRIARPFTADFVELERLLGEGKVREALELYKGPLLPDSEAPGVARIRERLDEAVRQAVLHVGERDLVIRLAKKFPEDLELWERAQEITPHTDPAYPLVRARVRRIQGEWGL